MKKILYVTAPFIIILIGFIFITAALPGPGENKRERKRERSGQENRDNLSEQNAVNQQNNLSSRRVKEKTVTEQKCKYCHTAEYPTPKEPGLNDCPREYMISVYQSPADGPETVSIEEMSDKYSGVVFSHRVHAEMSEMSQGCSGCHHYNTSGPILNCRNCHERSRAREDISIPDLKAAFHRQCMSCHKQWSGNNGCNSSCHIQKGKETENLTGNILIKTHPEIPEPEKIVWETNSDINKIVTFYHKEHTGLFRIKCTSCHTDESCIKCHDLKKSKSDFRKVKANKSLEEHHKPCISCHYGNKCTKCHNEKELAPFDHGKTGWTLSSYHKKLSCSSCHGNAMPYRTLSNKCVACHRDFAVKFDHKLKELIFSEAHTGLECANCHPKGDFTKSPVCTDCHDDKTFPADLPGNRK